MLVREERVLLSSKVRDCFCDEIFPICLNQKVYMLYQRVFLRFEMVLFGLVVVFWIFLSVLQNLVLRHTFRFLSL